MARDPNELKFPESWKDDPDDLKKLPPPPGVNPAEWNVKIASGEYYANVKVYQNGRQVVEWYKRNAGGGPGQPDPVEARSEGVVPTVKEEWDKEEAKPAPAPATRTINGVPHQVTGKDANGQDIWSPVVTSTGTATATTTAIPSDAVPRIEGTPLPGGGFDNEQPIKVWRRPDGTQVKVESLDATERKKWDEDRQKSRNPGGKTDADIKAERDKDDTIVVSTGYTGTGKNRKKVTTYKSGRTATEDAPTTATATSVTYTPDGTKVTKYDDGTETREQQAPDRVGKPTGRTDTVTKDGKTVKRTEYVLPDGKTEWREQAEPSGSIKLPPGAPEIDLSSPETARASFNALFTFVDRQVRAGTLTPKEGQDILAGPHQAVGNVLDAAKEQRVTGENLRRDQLTERSQDMTQTGNRLSFAQGTAGTAIKQSADLIKAAEGGESTIVPLMVLQAGMGQAMGGVREAPSIAMPAVAARAAAPFQAAAASLASPSMAGQPNQLGVGSVPGMMTPTGPAVRPDPAGAEAIRQQAMATAAATSANAGRLAAPPAVPPVAPARPPAVLPEATPGGGNPPPPPISARPELPEATPGGGPPPMPPIPAPPESGAIPLGMSPWGPMGGPPAFYRTGMQTDRTPDDIAQELIAAGADPRAVYAAQRRFMARLGAA